MLDAIKRSQRFAPSVTEWRVLEPRPGEFEPVPERLDPRIHAALGAMAVDRLYSHQAQTINAALDGEDVVIVTPTASGKSLCYQLPVLQSVLEDPTARALFLFPAKALGHDQLRNFREMAKKVDKFIQVHAYDGDTPNSARPKIRSSAHVILTNPDMLHVGILPQHARWQSFFQNLRLVVIDEIHTCRGIFGSHVANVLRRLERVCEFHRSRPQFICCSATIANPGELARDITGRESRVIDRSGAPTGRKTVVFYEPPLLDAETGLRRSSIKEARALAVRFLARSHQTILFARSRLRAEVLTTYLKRAVKKLGGDPGRVQGYRGGYLPEERRAIEKDLREGRILGVVGTNALELGIDIGSLRVAVLCGYPGSISSAWQQIGRAGRGSESSAAILVGSASPLDQYVIRHPDYFFGSAPESGVVNPDNPMILEGHLKCAAAEIPFDRGEPFGNMDPSSVLQSLGSRGELRAAGERFFWAGEQSPAYAISLRSASARRFTVVDETQENLVLGEVDEGSAPFIIYPGAVYLHQTRAYLIQRLEWDEGVAYARPTKTDFYTEPLDKTRIKILAVEESESREAEGALVRSRVVNENQWGRVAVKTVVEGYRKVRFETHQILGYGEFSMPEIKMETQAWWIGFPVELQFEMAALELSLQNGLWGMANLVANAIPLYVLCDVLDYRVRPMGGDPAEDADEDEADTLFRVCAYDNYPGGIGVSEKAWRNAEAILKTAREIVQDCPCAYGCPSCIGPGVEPNDQGKRSVIYLLENILARK
jgi:DEAD/DEAH box helicase domain-containing protein